MARQVALSRPPERRMIAGRPLPCMVADCIVRPKQQTTDYGPRTKPMKIHEYQSRKILADAGIPVPPAEVVFTPDEAATAFKRFGGEVCVVKAQVYAGGRGKAGFVKLVKSADEAR